MFERLAIRYLAKLLRERYDSNAEIVIRSNGFACYKILKPVSDTNYKNNGYHLDIL